MLFTEARVMDETGRPVTHGQIGQLIPRGGPDTHGPRSRHIGAICK
jgi:non-ribosomal peptide synthetase component E (peptide arylation enzyme)